MSEVERCSYVLPRKQRRCRMLVKKGAAFCGEHAIFDPSNEERIVCPLDQKHTVLRRELEAHLAICNSRILEAEWISEGANAVRGGVRYDEKIDMRPAQEDVEETLPLLDECYASFANQLVVEMEMQSEIEDFLRSDEGKQLGPQKLKHLRQLSSITGHLQKTRLLVDSPQSCIIDLGAGKAQLAYWMAKAAPRSRFVLVDRMGVRNKYDNKAKQENADLEMRRLRCSIEDLELVKVDEAANSELSAVCKHLCGAGTDAAIRCLLGAMDGGVQLKGFCLVPCCLHKTRYREYTGREFLSHFNLDEENKFAALRYIASWAVCGLDTAEDEQGDNVVPWSASWKERQGRRAKAVLEWGRAEALRRRGFNVAVVEYISTSISPENLLIVGTRVV